MLNATRELLAGLPPWMIGLGVLIGIAGALGAAWLF